MPTEQDCYQQVVRQLVVLMDKNDWRRLFEEAIKKVQHLNVKYISQVTTVEDFLDWLNDVLTKPPKFLEHRQEIYDDACAFRLFLNQKPLKNLQTTLALSPQDHALTPLSEWIVQYMKSWGSYLDTIDSAKYIQTFKKDPMLVWNDYMEPPCGYLTFNQFFARHVKPGKRPIANITDPRVIVSPADSIFIGSWNIDEDLNIHLEKVLNLKGLKWSIAQLLHDSPYKDAFKGGSFSHSFLNVYDYHRFHSPVEGRVLEARVIQGQAYLGVEVVEKENGEQKLNILEAIDETGYHFTQMRGLVVIDSPIGLVACLPVGMTVISSIVLTLEVGELIRKGEEIGYFQAGGSDFVLVFQKQSNVELCWKEGVKRKQGEMIGTSRWKDA